MLQKLGVPSLASRQSRVGRVSDNGDGGCVRPRHQTLLRYRRLLSTVPRTFAEVTDPATRPWRACGLALTGGGGFRAPGAPAARGVGQFDQRAHGRTALGTPVM